MSELEERYVIEARLLGQDKTVKRRWMREKEFAIDVTLSDESNYVIFRTVKEITNFHSKLVARFPVEAGYFKKSDMIIPDCPLKQTIFGPSRVIREDRVFEKLLNSYLKELPGLPASIVKCDLIKNFFALRGCDMSEPGQQQQSKPKPKKKRNPIVVTDDSTISGPMKLRSYYAVAEYSDAKSKFSFPEGAVVQVLQKDASGWWMVDANGKIGWAPASYLVPVDEGDLAEEAKENEKLMSSMRVGSRYISMSAYQASRDDEISFVKGAIVRLIKKYADGWWLVRYNGGEGFVPGSMFRRFDRRQGTAYVKNIRRNFRNRKSTRIVPTMKPKWMANPSSTPASGLMLYQCLTRYRGSDSSEISMNKNDILKVLDKKDHGWWYVEDRHGRTGWAPATYLGPVVDRLKENSEPRKNAIVGSTREVRQAYSAQQGDELSVKKGDKVVVLSAPDDGWWVVSNVSTREQGLIPSVCLDETADPPTEPPSEILESIQEISDALEKVEEEKEEEEEEEEEQDASSSASDGEDILQEENYYIATANYSKQAQDELSVFQGQVVCVVDDSDESMFYVVIDGKEGWIPANILRIMSEEEMEGFSNSTGSSRSQSRSRSPSPFPTRSRSPSPYPSHSHSPSRSRSPTPARMCDDNAPRKRRFPHQSSSPSTIAPQARKISAPAAVTTPLPRQLSSPPATTTQMTLSNAHPPLSDTSQSLGLSNTDEADYEVATINSVQDTSSGIQIRVEEIEQAALEAEKLAEEAQRRAMELRKMAQKVKRTRSSPVPQSD